MKKKMMKKKEKKKEKKKKKKKRNVAGCYWATAHFQHALGHDTTICIMTQRLGRLA